MGEEGTEEETQGFSSLPSSERPTTPARKGTRRREATNNAKFTCRSPRRGEGHTEEGGERGGSPISLFPSSRRYIEEEDRKDQKFYLA